MPGLSASIRIRLASRRLGFALLDLSPLLLAIGAAALCVAASAPPGPLSGAPIPIASWRGLAAFAAALALLFTLSCHLAFGPLNLLARAKAQRESADPWASWASLSREAFAARRDRLAVEIGFAPFVLALAAPALIWPPLPGARLPMAMALASFALLFAQLAVAAGPSLPGSARLLGAEAKALLLGALAAALWIPRRLLRLPTALLRAATGEASLSEAQLRAIEAESIREAIGSAEPPDPGASSRARL